MKKHDLILVLLLLFLGSPGQTQTRTISITMKELICDFRGDLKPSAEKAFQIATEIFNSKEFQDDIRKMTFDCNSFCRGCKSIEINSEGRISGEKVLEILFRESKVEMTLEIRENGGALGETSEGEYYTTAWYNNINSDMPEFESNFSLGLAVNLCHEYMHQVGFCHLYCGGWFCPKKDRLREPNGNPDKRFIKEDVTYKVGWAAYYLLKKWKEGGKTF